MRYIGNLTKGWLNTGTNDLHSADLKVTRLPTLKTFLSALACSGVRVDF